MAIKIVGTLSLLIKRIALENILMVKQFEIQLRMPDSFPHLSIHRRLRCLRETPAIIYKSRFITHNSGSRIFSRRYLETYRCGLKSQSDDERNLSIEFHETAPPGVHSSHKYTHTHIHTHTHRTLSFNSSTSPPADKHSCSVLQSHRA